MSFTTVNNIKLYYELHGSGEPIVLISGFTADHTVWQYVFDKLSKEHQVLIFDNRGAGQSDAPDITYNIAMMADDTVALMDALNIAKAHIIGQSMGSAIAMQLAASYPEKVNKLILCSASAKTNTISKMVIDFIYHLHKDKANPSYIGEAITPWCYSDKTLSSLDDYPHLKERFAYLSNNPYPQSLQGHARQLEALKSFDAKDILANIKASTLVLAGEYDLLAPLRQAQYLAEHIANAKFVIMQKLAHQCHNECPNEFCEIILNFLNMKF